MPYFYNRCGEIWQGSTCRCHRLARGELVNSGYPALGSTSRRRIAAAVRPEITERRFVQNIMLLAPKKVSKENTKKLVTSLQKNHRPLAGTTEWNSLTNLQRTHSMTRAANGSKENMGSKLIGKSKANKPNTQVTNRPSTLQDPA